MKLITVAKITLNKPTSLGAWGFQRLVRKDLSVPMTVKQVILNGDNAGDVLEEVKELALSDGETQSFADGLTVCAPRDAPQGTMCFNDPASPTGIEFPGYYAEADVFPALEIDGRFFRLGEVYLTA